MLILASFAARLVLVAAASPAAGVRSDAARWGANEPAGQVVGLLWYSPYAIALILCAGSGLCMIARREAGTAGWPLRVARAFLSIGAVVCALDACLLGLSNDFTIWRFQHEWWPGAFSYDFVLLSLVFLSLVSFRLRRDNLALRAVLSVSLVLPGAANVLIRMSSSHPLTQQGRINILGTVFCALCGALGFLMLDRETDAPDRRKGAASAAFAWLSGSILIVATMNQPPHWYYRSPGIADTVGMLLLLSMILWRAAALRTRRDAIRRITLGVAMGFMLLSLLDLWAALAVETDVAASIGILDTERAASWFPFAVVLSGVALVVGAAQSEVALPGLARALSAAGFFVGSAMALVGLYRRGTTALEILSADHLTAPGLGIAAAALLTVFIGLLRQRSRNEAADAGLTGG